MRSDALFQNGKPAKEGKEKEPYRDAEGEPQNIDRLTAEQQEAVNRISGAIEGGRQENFLLHGVTGSGKTEVYMQAVDRTLKMGKTAIMLVPEIALTKQITDRFIGRFGKDRIAVLHSKLTRRERFDEWIAHMERRSEDRDRRQDRCVCAGGKSGPCDYGRGARSHI